MYLNVKTGLYIYFLFAENTYMTSSFHQEGGGGGGGV